ncbi:MAG: hypothetical protein AAFR88_09375 [Pseudomonadota bacterium]
MFDREKLEIWFWRVVIGVFVIGWFIVAGFALYDELVSQGIVR